MGNWRVLVRSRGDRRGSQFVEAGLALIPFLALILLAFDAGWAVWVKTTLQHAVREGVRYGVTGQTSGAGGQIASIVAVVQQDAMGLLDGTQSGTISVQFYDPATQAQTSSNVGGNIIEVSIQNYQLTPFAPLLWSGNPISINVQAADVIEPSPGGIAPTP